jgi:Tfp pilus assembly protein PilF
MRAVVFVHLIPPGAADTVHYRLHIPNNAGEKITLHAKLNYRKFMWWNTQFAYAGQENSELRHGDVAPDYDDRKWSFNGDTQTVAGNLKKVPDLPVITIAEDTKTVRVLPQSAAAPKPETVLTKEDWVRWNDYGIGLFLQGDLKGSEAAFQKVAEIAPENPDGWVNIGRALVQEGDTDSAKVVLEKALALSPQLARTNYFYARVLKEEGKYDEAITHLKIVLVQYPQDRVVHNELGRVLFLQKKYADAVAEFQKTLAIDPEDLQAHYNLMICYSGLGDEAHANEHKTRYLRFKADEAAQAITGPYRQAHAEDNSERQAVHEHVSVTLGAPSPVKKAAPAYTGKTAAHSVSAEGLHPGGSK